MFFVGKGGGALIFEKYFDDVATGSCDSLIFDGYFVHVARPIAETPTSTICFDDVARTDFCAPTCDVI